MDFRPTRIAIKPGKLEEAIRELTRIFGCGPTDRGRGWERYRIVQNDINWYSPLNVRPMIALYTFEYEVEKIHMHLKEMGLAV